MSNAFRVSGINETLASLNMLGAAISSDAPEILKQYAYEIKGLASKFAPKKSGDLEKAGRVYQRSSQGYPVFEVRFTATNRKSREMYSGKMEDWQGKWGKGTAAKAAALGMTLTNATQGAFEGVGAGYLRRAADIMTPRIIEAVRNELKAAIARASAQAAARNNRPGRSRRKR